MHTKFNRNLFPLAAGFRLAALTLLGLAAAPAAHAQSYTLNTLVNFTGSNGDQPLCSLTLIGGTLYGTTAFSNASGPGTVFSIPVSGGTPTTLATITGSNGVGPSSLTLSADGSTLYGITNVGGVRGDGTVFSVPVGGGTITTLATFTGSNGQEPAAGLTLSADGTTLYGTTVFGGANGYGTVFSVPVTGGTPADLVSFNGSNGAGPGANLTLSGNTLYGTTENGGVNNHGTVFSIPVSGGAPTVLASFTGSNGASPAGGLTLLGSTLYGTTSGGGAYGGANGYGTVFSVSIGGGTPNTLASFAGSNGYSPRGGLTLLGGTFYGTTAYGGANDDGTAFSVPITGGVPADLVSFTGSNGQYPEVSLTPGPDGTLYGTTTLGGTHLYGTVFSLTPAAVPEASSVVSFGLLLTLGLGGIIAARKKNAGRRVEKMQASRG